MAALLDAIPRVLYSIVDPRWVRRPQDNKFNAPVFANGDIISLDPLSWELAVAPELLFPPSGGPGPYGLDNPGERLTGDIRRYRRSINGLSVCPGG